MVSKNVHKQLTVRFLHSQFTVTTLIRLSWDWRQRKKNSKKNEIESQHCFIYCDFVCSLYIFVNPQSISSSYSNDSCKPYNNLMISITLLWALYTSHQITSYYTYTANMIFIWEFEYNFPFSQRRNKYKSNQSISAPHSQSLMWKHFTILFSYSQHTIRTTWKCNLPKQATYRPSYVFPC